MIRNAVAGALARPGRWLASAAFASVLLAIPAAVAGDRALLDLIGYSGEGRYFAFEEFGYQDGSGFPYANIYVVDLTIDAWASTPVKVLAEDEYATLAQVRDAARLQAAGAITKAGIDQPADIVALIGDGTLDTDAQALQFGLAGYGPGAVNGDYQLEITQFSASAGAPCEEWNASPPLGFALALTAAETTREVHRDTEIPESRGCPTAYRIYGVVTPFNAETLAAGVAIVSVYPSGFEGPDRRFLAVPLGE